MHEDQDTPSQTPKASSSSNPSGTQALRVRVEPEPSQTVPAPENAELPPEPAPVEDEAFQTAVEALYSPPPFIEQPSLAATAEQEPPTEEAVTGTPVGGSAYEPVRSGFTNAVADTAAQPVETIASSEDVPVQVMAEPTAAHGSTTEELRQAVRETLATNATKRELADEMSRTFGVMLDEARHDAALIGRKLMEFVQANFENNVELARDYAGARSVPEIVNIHAAYVKRQIDLLSRQAEEFRALTSDIASKKAEKFQTRMKA